MLKTKSVGSSIFAYLFMVANIAFAIPIEDVQFNDGEKIGIFIASFDPPSLAHDHIIQEALTSCDKLIVLPTDFTPHKPFRTDTSHRQAMLAAAYAASPNIITIRPYTKGYPQSRFVVKDLRNEHRETMSFVLGEDLTSRLNSAVIAWLLPADTQTVLDAPDSQGSSAIRNYFKEHPEFFALPKEEMEKVDQSTLPLLPAVKDYIWRQGLYGPQSHTTYFGFAQDVFYTVPALFGRFFWHK